MRRSAAAGIVGCLIAALAGGAAHADFSGPSNPITATGSTTPLSLQDRFAETFDIAGYGAKCDGVTDDAAAINLATAAARTTDLTGVTVKITGPFNKRCKILSSIDMTRFTNSPVIWDVPTILCSTNGTPCVDAAGSKFVHWVSLEIIGTSSLTPNIGLQVARTATASGNEHQADHMWIQGFFTFASMYNESVEVSQWNHLVLLNQQVSASAYALVMDGANHFNATSAFTTIGLSQDVQNSFNDNTFIGGSFQQVGGGIPIWTSATAGHRYVGSYAETISGAACVMLYDNSHGSNLDIKFDHLHCEVSPVTDVFLVSGTNASPILKGFQFNDFSPQASNSILKLDTGVTSATLHNPTIRIEQTQFPAFKLFDSPLAWTVLGGQIWLPADSNWSNPPALFTGCLGTSGSTACAPSNPLAASNMIVNGDMRIDQQNEGAKQTSSRYVDRWATDFRGGITILTAGQRVTSTPAPGYTYSLQMASGAGTTVTSTQASNVRQSIEGPSFSGALWGTASAAPLTCGLWVNASTTGDYPIAIANASSARSYVTTYNIPSANTWTYRTVTIPGDQSGTWTTAPNTIGAVVYLNLGAGSTFQTTANAWGAGLFFATSGTVQLAALNTQTFNFTGFHCNFGVVDLGYTQPAYDVELRRVQRHYVKSIIQGTAVAQNAGAGGAVSFQLPFAQTTFATAATGVRFPVAMFMNNGATTPTITFFSPSAASANCYNQTKARDSGAAAVTNNGSAGFLVTCTLVTGDALGDAIALHYTASTTF